MLHQIERPPRHHQPGAVAVPHQHLLQGAEPIAKQAAHGGGVRSLNLATAAGVVLFEALRQLNAED